MCVATNSQLNNYMNAIYPGIINIRLAKKENDIVRINSVYALCSLGNNSEVSLYDSEDARDAAAFKSCFSKISINVDLIKEFACKTNVLRINYINGLRTKSGLILDKGEKSSNMYCTPAFNTDNHDENCWVVIDEDKEYEFYSSVYETAMNYFETKKNKELVK